MMTAEQQVDASRKLLASFFGMHPGDMIMILTCTLQMAICYGARTKEDAVKMIGSIARDSVRDIPQQYDLVQKAIKDANDAGGAPVRH
jgi:hypothetical protein